MRGMDPEGAAKENQQGSALPKSDNECHSHGPVTSVPSAAGAVAASHESTYPIRRLPPMICGRLEW